MSNVFASVIDAVAVANWCWGKHDGEKTADNLEITALYHYKDNVWRDYQHMDCYYRIYDSGCVWGCYTKAEINSGYYYDKDPGNPARSKNKTE